MTAQPKNAKVLILRNNNSPRSLGTLAWERLGVGQGLTGIVISVSA